MERSLHSFPSREMEKSDSTHGSVRNQRFRRLLATKGSAFRRDLCR